MLTLILKYFVFINLRPWQKVLNIFNNFWCFLQFSPFLIFLRCCPTNHHLKCRNDNFNAKIFHFMQSGSMAEIIK